MFPPKQKDVPMGGRTRRHPHRDRHSILQRLSLKDVSIFKDGKVTSEYESDSEEQEDEKPTPQFRPVFVPKRARATIFDKEAMAQLCEEVARGREHKVMTIIRGCRRH